jgi:hypothetical protein
MSPIAHIIQTYFSAEFQAIIIMKSIYSYLYMLHSLPEGQEKFVMIADLSGWTYRNMDLRGSLVTAEILQVCIQKQ